MSLVSNWSGAGWRKRHAGPGRIHPQRREGPGRIEQGHRHIVRRVAGRERTDGHPQRPAAVSSQVQLGPLVVAAAIAVVDQQLARPSVRCHEVAVAITVHVAVRDGGRGPKGPAKGTVENVLV